MDSERVFVLDRTREGSAVLALDLRTGREHWCSEGSGLPLAPKADSDWRPALADGNRLVYRSDSGLACLDTRTGGALWRASVTAESDVYHDVVVVQVDWTISLLSAENGRLLKKKDLKKALTARHPQNKFTTGSAISETHIFVCDQLGTLWALDRERLDPVWSHCPAGTVGGLNSPQIVRGRLYANTVSWERGVPNHLYCWGPAKAGESPGASAPDVIETEGELPFVIVESLNRRQVTRKAPFHEAGGPFTVYRCRLDDGGAEFLFADRVGRGGGLLHGAAEALWVSSVEQGEALLRAFRASMPPDRRMKKPAPPLRVNPPTLFKGVDLLGPGGKQCRLWTSLDGEAELVVEWDAKTKKGLVREKDDIFREGVLKLIADLLVRR
jgi:hypothetical protein